MRIGQLADQTGMTIDTIRYYERQGLLDRSHLERSKNGYRDYSAHAVERLAMIRQAQAAGFTLAEIRDLLSSWDRNELDDDLIVARLQEKQRQIAARIAELEQIQCHIAEKLRQYAAGRVAG